MPDAGSPLAPADECHRVANVPPVASHTRTDLSDQPPETLITYQDAKPQISSGAAVSDGMLTTRRPRLRN